MILKLSSQHYLLPFLYKSRFNLIFRKFVFFNNFLHKHSLHQASILPIIDLPTRAFSVATKRKIHEQIENENEHLDSKKLSMKQDEASKFFITDNANLTKQRVLSYIHVCIYNDNLSEAHNFLTQLFNKVSHSLSSADLAYCCESLIKGWARKGNSDNVFELINFIKNTLRKQLNIRIYEYYLLALAKQIKETTINDIKEIFKMIENENIKSEFLFSNSTLNSKEINMIQDFLNVYGIRIESKNPSLFKNVSNDHLNIIKFNNEPKYYDPFEGLDLSKMNTYVERQFNSEIASVVKIEPIDARFYDNEIKKPEGLYKGIINLLEAEWKEALKDGFQNYLQIIRTKNKRLNGIPFIQYMTILEPEVYVEAMLEEIRKCSSFSEHYSPFSHQLFETLGRKIMSNYIHRSNMEDGTLDDFKKCYDKYVQYTMNPELIMKFNPREYWQYLLENGYHYYFDDSKYWPTNVLREIGKDLYEIISNETNFNTIFLEMIDDQSPSIQPVISFAYKNYDIVKIKKEIRVHHLLIKLYEGARSHIHFETERLPMLTPPVPWISNNFGGNLLIRDFIIRLPPLYQSKKLEELSNTYQMYPAYDSLNALSLCPWKINSKILDIAISIFKNKGNTDLDIPVSLSAFDSLPQTFSSMTQKEKAQTYYKKKMMKKEQAEMYSLWVDCLYKLSIGNHLRDKIFWFPNNTDFRSRVYPIPPNFNHLGNDLSRSLLLFAKGKPLGELGLDWLKIHLINLTGLKKKSSNKERLNYCNEMLDIIMDSADNPLDGQKWWMQSDEKWQTLACCIEITKAIRSGNPSTYISHFPVHQDGSCNGLQHYAALGRDVLGAKSVNLAPSETPRDVYSDVATLVESDIESDIEKGIQLAQIVKGYISRKVVKQTVMTYVYGVTKYGAKLQVLKRLKEDPNFPESQKVMASLYISEKIFLSIRKMFTQTRAIQDWLTNCAQIISNDYGSTVDWVTPLGFPVIQSYYKNVKKTNYLIPNTMKQKNAFPANFIHSLDSSHMMLTALECHHSGLTFASVHDCYWTHPSNVDQMNYFCRKQFVALHEQPILDDLACHLKTQIEKLNQIRNVPNHSELVSQVDQRIPKGNFDLQSVMNSVYFFS